MLRPARPGRRRAAATSAGSGCPTRTAPAAAGLAGAGRRSRSTRPPRPSRTASIAAATSSTSGRTVTGIQDEVLDLDAFDRGRPDTATVAGEGALMPSLNAHRTGRMRDIVATIQAEQDRIIRAAAARRAGRAGRPGHRQDRGGAAPGGLPALRAPRPAGPQRGAGRRPEHRCSCATSSRCCPASARPACVLATAGQLYPGVDATGRRARGGRRGQGRRADGRVLAARGPGPAAGAGRVRSTLTVDGSRHHAAAAPRSRAAPGSAPSTPASRTTRPGSGSSPTCSAAGRRSSPRVRGVELDDDRRPELIADLRGVAATSGAR